MTDAQHPSTPPQSTEPVRDPSTPATKRRRNVLGIIALALAVVGFIFAMIPGALIMGWVLLPISFILGLISLFRKGAVKWQGVTALIVAVVGTIVGVVVFFAVVATAVSDAVDDSSDVQISEGSDSAVAEAKRAPSRRPRVSPPPRSVRATTLLPWARPSRVRSGRW